MSTSEGQSRPSVSELWRELVVENPMAIEISRFRRKFLEGGRGKTVNTMILVVAIIAYAGLLLLIADESGDFPPVALIYLQTGVFAFLAPALLYTSIAGEREKRSWDLLCAAPITHAQIVVGKFMAALAGLGLAFALFLLPTLFTAFTYKGDSFAYMNGYEHISGTWALIGEEVISVTFAMSVAALTLLFSARCKRSLMALGIVLGFVFLGIVALPMLRLGLGSGNSAADVLALGHPFLAIERLEELRRSTYSGSIYGSGPMDGFSAVWFGVPQALLYLFFTGVFLVWADKTVNFADGEKKFIPRKSDA